MSEKILEIKDVDEGYDVLTSEQTIHLRIEGGQCCCENWGHFWCNEKPEDFVGAELLGVSVVDDALDTKIIEQNGADSRDEGGIMFVNIDTSKGKLQFVAYNCHNGYYGHSASVESKHIIYEQTL